MSYCATMPLYMHEHIQCKKLKLNGQAHARIDLFLNTGIGNSVPYSDQKCMDYGASCIDYADQSCMDYPVVWIMYPGFHFTSLVLLAAFVTNV